MILHRRKMIKGYKEKLILLIIMVDSVATHMETALNLDTMTQENTANTHILGDEWTMWAHLPRHRLVSF